MNIRLLRSLLFQGLFLFDLTRVVYSLTVGRSHIYSNCVIKKDIDPGRVISLFFQ